MNEDDKDRTKQIEVISPDNDSPEPEAPEDTPDESDVQENSEAADSDDTSEETEGSEPSPTETPLAPSLPADDPEPNSNVVVPTGPKSSKKMFVIIVLVVIVLIGGGVAAYAMNHHTKKKAAAKQTTSSSVKQSAPNKAVGTDTWTGKGNDANWDNGANWSLGVPQNNDSLLINAAAITQPVNGGEFIFNNNVANLTVNKVIIEGTSDNSFSVKGNPLTITNGIDQNIVAATTGGSPIQVAFNNPVTFGADQTVQAADGNSLTFATAPMNIGSHTIEFMDSGDGIITVMDAITGTGELDMPASNNTASGLISFDMASPGFKGSVVIDEGITVGLGNDNAAGTGLGTTSAFGSSTIDIGTGATLQLVTTESTSFTLANQITMSGHGSASHDPGTGAYTGALTACITKEQEGCDAGVTVNLTGHVTLADDTELGAQYGLENPNATPSGTTVTYVFKNVTTNSHTLLPITDSKVVIQK